MGRGSSKLGGAGGGLGGGGTGGGAFTFTPNANGGITITPNPNAPNAATLAGAGSGISDVNSHTTYFTPADRAIVGADNTNGYRISPRTGNRVPVGYYQTGDYANVNGELRDLGDGKRKSLSPQTQAVVDAMDRNMRPLNAPLETTRWIDVNALADNVGMRGASRSQIENALAGSASVTRTKSDYTSSSWNAKDNAVAGNAGRYVQVKMHYAKGATGQFSPTGLEAEFVGARGKAQTFTNARRENVVMYNKRNGTSRVINATVIDCYVND